MFWIGRVQRLEIDAARRDDLQRGDRRGGAAPLRLNANRGRWIADGNGPEFVGVAGEVEVQATA